MSQATDAHSTSLRAALQGAINQYNSAHDEDCSCLDIANAKARAMLARPAQSVSDIVDLAAVVEFYNEDGDGRPGTAELVAAIFKLLGDTDQTH
jgi:hypothetical protein